MLKFAIQVGCDFKYDRDACKIAAKYRRLEMLKYLHSTYDLSLYGVLLEAIRNDDVEILEFALVNIHENKYEVCRKEVDMYGVLVLLHKNKMPLYEELKQYALSFSDNEKIIEFCKKN
jgi:hypothetical protein